MKSRLVFILLTMVACVSISAQEIFYNLRKTETVLDSNKTNIIICLSLNSCHDCYMQTNAFLLQSRLLGQRDVDIVTVCFVNREEFQDISYRKQLYNKSKYYFPDIDDRLFCIDDDGNFFNERIDVRFFPFIFVIEGGNKKVYRDYRDFITDYAIKLNLI